MDVVGSIDLSGIIGSIFSGTELSAEMRKSNGFILFNKCDVSYLFNLFFERKMDSKNINIVVTNQDPFSQLAHILARICSLFIWNLNSGFASKNLKMLYVVVIIVVISMVCAQEYLKEHTVMSRRFCPIS